MVGLQGENHRIRGFSRGMKQRLGIAAALRFAPEGDDSSIEIASFARENGVAAALQQYCAITADDDVALIEQYYLLFNDMRNLKEVL